MILNMKNKGIKLNLTQITRAYVACKKKLVTLPSVGVWIVKWIFVCVCVCVNVMHSCLTVKAARVKEGEMRRGWTMRLASRGWQKGETLTGDQRNILGGGLIGQCVNIEEWMLLYLCQSSSSLVVSSLLLQAVAAVVVSVGVGDWRSTSGVLVGCALIRLLFGLRTKSCKNSMLKALTRSLVSRFSSLVSSLSFSFSLYSLIHQALTWGELWTRVNPWVLVPVSCADLPCTSVSPPVDAFPMAFQRPARVSLVTSFIILTVTVTIVIANVPTSPSVTSSSDSSSNPGSSSDYEWRAKVPKDLRIDVQGNNLSTGGSSNPSNHGEAASSMESLRYSVASFDFNHVATPYIISLWIIIVGLAKIGK